MEAFLLSWALLLASLLLSVGGLALLYRSKGASLGLRSPPAEVLLGVLTAAGQAAVYVWVLGPYLTANRILSLVVVLVTVAVYRLAHLEEMEWMEPTLIALGQAILLVAPVLVLHGVLA